MTELFFIPQFAWPALTQFAPERFPRLQVQFSDPSLGAEDQKRVRAEMESLVREFRASAVKYLRYHRKRKLLLMAAEERVRQTGLRPLLLARLLELDQADLTWKERERLLPRLSQQFDLPIKPIEDALQALDKPWRHRDYNPAG